ncbi:thioesterase family protein [Pseudooceanicola sp.]|uniref:acyl-CoA thioesterase n=1 Tax=Pseudooceanicola sp. TaxID=1914328 RepID=UPI002629D72A|nr:thioesterase family protein [Pseudooceanicola sp.]MDF1855264.1 thioesterase family protein [Pseudooceanicola sp.]
MANLREVLDGFSGEGAAQSIAAPEAWGQGRTLYGGMTAALCWHAATRALPDLPPLRGAQLAFVGPAQGQLEFTVSLLRRGRNSAVVQVACIGAAGPAASAIFTCANPRDSHVAHDLVPAPAAPAPETCEVFHRKPPKLLSFPAKFDIRLVSGSRPLSGGTPEMLVWTRLLDEAGVDPVTVLLATADVLPPGAMAEMSAWAPVSTMTWGVDFFQPVTATGWHLLHTYSDQAADGYSLQGSDMWDASGRRVLTARQIVAIFG